MDKPSDSVLGIGFFSAIFSLISLKMSGQFSIRRPLPGCSLRLRYPWRRAATPHLSARKPLDIALIFRHFVEVALLNRDNATGTFKGFLVSITTADGTLIGEMHEEVLQIDPPDAKVGVNCPH